MGFVGHLDMLLAPAESTRNGFAGICEAVFVFFADTFLKTFAKKCQHFFRAWKVNHTAKSGRQNLANIDIF